MGGVQDNEALPVVTDAGVTLIENALRLAVAVPSLTEMVTPADVAATAGVPLSWPVAALNVAQEGLFEMLKVSVSLSASVADGVNA